MKIKQLYEKCLSQASYYIEHQGEAAIIDPLRDISSYLELAKESGSRIKYIFETHFHADFVSGHLELAERAGAPIVFGPGAKTAFASYTATDGEKFSLGDASIEVLHTPGHTLESSCFLLRDEHQKEQAIFTGDTLFLGDVGRPDLAQSPEIGITREDLAGMLYDSLRKKILPLPDRTVVYPGHGAGSACGKNMSKETVGDLGSQKQTNYALNPALGRTDFIAALCDNLAAPPAYFPMNVSLNINGYKPLESVLRTALRPLSAPSFKQFMRHPDTLVLDTRHPDRFAEAHLPGSINIGIDGGFAPWVGALIPVNQENILIIAEPGREDEVMRRLARIGFHQCIGYLDKGITAWEAEGYDTSHVDSINAADFLALANTGNQEIIDARAFAEYEQGNVPKALNLPLDTIANHLDGLNKNTPYLVYCAGGYRSMIFISILKAKGFESLVNVEGGYNAIAARMKGLEV